MALFSHNKNRKALLGKQTLFAACCTPEIEPCCYPTDQLKPGPVCDCNNYDLYLNINGNSTPFSTFINLSQANDLPAIIYIGVKNNDACPIEITEVSVNSTSQYITGFLPISPFIVEVGNAENVFGFELSALAGQGGYTVDISFRICNFVAFNTIEILLVS